MARSEKDQAGRVFERASQVLLNVAGRVRTGWAVGPTREFEDPEALEEQIMRGILPEGMSQEEALEYTHQLKERQRDAQRTANPRITHT
jgi:hypothetical protein